MVRRPPRAQRRGPADGGRPGDRAHRALRLRQVDVLAHPQPDARAGAGRGPGGPGAARRRGHLRPSAAAHREPPPDRDGLPEGQPVPDHVRLRQRARRAEAHRPQGPRQGRRGRPRRAEPAQRRALGGGEGATRYAGIRALGWPAAAALHRPRPRRAPGRAAHGRALLGARPDVDQPDRGDHPGHRRRGDDRDRHPQHAAGPAGLGPLRVLPRRRGGARPHRRAGRHHRRVPEPARRAHRRLRERAVRMNHPTEPLGAEGAAHPELRFRGTRKAAP